MTRWSRQQDEGDSSVNLRLQYLAGLQNNQYEADAIYHQIFSQRRDPAPHLSASPELMQELRSTLDGY